MTSLGSNLVPEEGQGADRFGANHAFLLADGCDEGCGDGGGFGSGVGEEVEGVLAGLDGVGGLGDWAKGLTRTSGMCWMTAMRAGST